MLERFPKSVLIAVALVGPIGLAYVAAHRPWYFTSATYLGGLLAAELLVASVCFYRRFFFPITIVTFLCAGLNLPVGTGWVAGRWVVLAIGALIGLIIVLRERSLRFGLFHGMAFLAALSAFVSAYVSRYPEVALSKVLSLFLLFLYVGTGLRLAVRGREDRFFRGLLVGCEIFVAAVAILQAVGMEPMGNPNSLGAVMGVACAPVLLWGILIGDKGVAQKRRCLLYGVCMYLAFVSQSRAGLVAALISSGALILIIRRYKLLIEGIVILIVLLAGIALFSPAIVTSLFASVVYKAGDQSHAILESRVSPWNAAVDNISEHPWFGTGLGTTATGMDANANINIRQFSSTQIVTTENGSSYLVIVSGVGILGVPPFAVVLILLVGKILRTIRWVWVSKTVFHPAVPVAMVTLAGIIHATFEDWMFAPGYYLCVFFWGMSFILVDAVPAPFARSKAKAMQASQTTPRRGAIA